MGHVKAMVNLAILCDRGLGLGDEHIEPGTVHSHTGRQNPTTDDVGSVKGAASESLNRAHQWFELAASLGDAVAIKHLSRVQHQDVKRHPSAARAPPALAWAAQRLPAHNAPPAHKAAAQEAPARMPLSTMPAPVPVEYVGTRRRIPVPRSRSQTHTNRHTLLLLKKGAGANTRNGRTTSTSRNTSSSTSRSTSSISANQHDSGSNPSSASWGTGDATAITHSCNTHQFCHKSTQQQLVLRQLDRMRSVGRKQFVAHRWLHLSLQRAQVQHMY